MKRSDNIKAELGSISSKVAQCTAVDIYHVPEGYFQQLPSVILQAVKAAEAPEPTLDLEMKEVYDVPDTYFDSVAAHVLSEIKNSGALARKLPKDNPFEVPSGYFEQLSSSVLDRLQGEVPVAEELAMLSPLVADLKGLPEPLAVPAAYWEHFRIPKFGKAASSVGTTKVKEHPAVRSLKWARWAAAAAVLAIFCFGGWQYLGMPTDNTGVDLERSLAAIPEAQIKAWLSNNMDEADVNSIGANYVNASAVKVQTKVNQLSNNDIEKYLDAEVW
ncbi:MAG: hypothetical protein QM642_09900 [Edaphocola sp.]